VHHAHGGGGELGGHQGHLADAFAGQHLADPARAAAVVDERAQAALHQQIKRLARLALADQGLARRHRQPRRRRHDRAQLILGHPAHQLRSQQQSDRIFRHEPRSNARQNPHGLSQSTASASV
jgi:hypothetical protein